MISKALNFASLFGLYVCCGELLMSLNHCVVKLGISRVHLLLVELSQQFAARGVDELLPQRRVDELLNKIGTQSFGI